MMMTCAPSAQIVRPVSISDSPFSTLEAVAETSVVVAPSTLAANSKETRVRVEAS